MLVEDTHCEDLYYSINTKFGNWAIVIRDNVVIDAAPIMRWAIGKPMSVVRRYLDARNGTAEKLNITGRWVV